MGFVRFEGTRARNSFTFPICSINKEGSLSFNVAAIRKFSLEKDSSCELFFDKEAKLIGIKLVPKGSDFAVKIRTESTNALAINSKYFCEFCGIKNKKTKKYPIYKMGEYIIINLSKTVR